ncbi:MAG TPA: hypothetical protein VNC50_16775 [Planctomycetia bacterium]|jgi:hypothetical protein|nr:hypothetical protein [Planctomycetia bacterium]
MKMFAMIVAAAFLFLVPGSVHASPCDGVCGVQQSIGFAPVYQVQQQIVQAPVYAAPQIVQAAPVYAAPQVLQAPVIVRQQAYCAPAAQGVVVRQAAPVVVKQRSVFAGRGQSVSRQAVAGGGGININAARGARVKVR